jgi:hypothetical protein
LGGCCDALTVGTARRGLHTAPLPLAFPLAEGFHYPHPASLRPLAPKVAIERGPMAEVRGQQAPPTASLVDIENASDYPPEVLGLSSRAAKPPLGLEQQETEDIPWRIAHLCGIVTPGTPRQDSLPRVWVVR